MKGTPRMLSPKTLAQRLKAMRLRWLARRRRARGRYDERTLQLYRQAHQTGDADACLDYALFKRDLGHPLQTQCVDELLTHGARLSTARQWQVAALLREIGHPGLDGQWTSDNLGLGLSHAAPNQHDWRGALGDALVAARAHGICVVGNAGTLVGSRLGDAIDSAGMVIRFNRFRSARATTKDIGSKLSVWVTAPDYRGPSPEQVDWVVVSGPEVCYRLRDWAPFEKRLRAAQPVLTVPLACWRDLVGTLGAPPSAGVLTLAWLRHLLGGWSGISAAGIGSGLTGGYHHAGNSWSPSSRHAWSCEAALVERWIGQGLRVLPR